MDSNTEGYEGRDIPVLSGVVTPEHIARINSAQLIDGNEYSCDRCGRKFRAPEVYRCICGMKICNGCYPAHESEG